MSYFPLSFINHHNFTTKYINVTYNNEEDNLPHVYISKTTYNCNLFLLNFSNRLIIHT